MLSLLPAQKVLTMSSFVVILCRGIGRRIFHWDQTVKPVTTYRRTSTVNASLLAASFMVMFFLACADSVWSEEDGSLKIATKLGVETIVPLDILANKGIGIPEVDHVASHCYTSHLIGLRQEKFILQAEEGVYFVIPYSAFLTATEDQGQHTVVLANSKILKGQLLSVVRSSERNKQYDLSQCTRVEWAVKPDKGIDEEVREGLWKMSTPKMNGFSCVVANPCFVYEYFEAGGFMTAGTRSVDESESFKLKTGDGEFLANMSDFAALTFRAKEPFLTIRANNGTETSGSPTVRNGQAKFLAMEYKGMLGTMIVLRTPACTMTKLPKGYESGNQQEKKGLDVVRRDLKTVAPKRPESTVTRKSSDLVPSYNNELRGRNVVRVRNPNDFSVYAAIRSGTRGKDFLIPAKMSRTVKIGNGDYDIYFVYSSEPGKLYQGDSFSLLNEGIEIKIVQVADGNYRIRQVR